ncbi:MAG: DUF349 domain-containing protein [Pseudomonadota bacterium]|nr:DUF349 domain-containing protein [Pseudomonadota bacterium]
MVLFEKFFRSRSRNEKKWQDAEPEIRRQALQAFSSDAERLEFIRHETTAALRAEAVALLDSEASLDELLHSSHDEIRHQARDILLARLLPAGTGIDQISDADALIRIAALTTDNELRLQAIGRISDEQKRLQLALEHPVARVRLAAAEGIHDADKLHTLQEHAQGKDKTLYRLAKERLAENKARQQQQQARTDAVEQLLQQARYLNKVGYQPDFNGKLQLLGQQWPELRPFASAEQQHSIDEELNKARAILDQHAEEEARLAREQEDARQAAEHQQQLLERLQQLAGEAAAASAADLQQALKLLEQSWDQTFQQHRPAAGLSKAFENQLQQLLRLQSALSHYEQHKEQLHAWLNSSLADGPAALKAAEREAGKWHKALSWPDDFATPDWFSRLQQRSSDIRSRLQQIQDEQKSRSHDLRRQLDDFSTHLNEGQLKEAGRLSNKIQQGLRLLDEKSAAPLQREFRALNSRLQEMRDWAGFATAPKKEALVAAMEALTEADMAPDLLASKIHDLQEEWKTLGTAPGDNELWERFQAAGDKAFEPCRAYFAQVAEQREQNITLREQLIAELTSYEQALDWQQADWKAVQKTLDAARETFRQYSPVERQAHKRTQDAFRDACDRIYAHLKQEYDRNLQARQALIDEAEAVASADDLSGAADHIKNLQARWKDVGVTPRKADQKLWQNFRKHCDQVFSRLNENRAARKAELDETVAQAEAVVSRATELVTAADDTDGMTAQFAALRAEFAAIELPRSAHQRLSKTLKQAEQQLQQRQQQQQQQAELARWDGLISRLQNLRADADSWQTACQQALPDGYPAERFEQARQGTLSSDDSPRDLCILMEALADISSEEADKPRRMALQVQRLAQGMGQSLNRADERRELVERWLAVADDSLSARFIAALKAGL